MMNEQDRLNADDRSLWLAARLSMGERNLGERPGPTAVAAYLDGRLEPAERDRMEAWMIAAPEVLDLVAAARAATHADTVPAPDAVVTRAQALRPGSSGLSARLADWLGAAVKPVRLAALSGAAAAAILAAITGFELGRISYGQIAGFDSVLTEDLEIGFEQDDLI